MEASTAQTANRCSQRRSTVSGPATAMAVARAPKATTHSGLAADAEHPLGDGGGGGGDHEQLEGGPAQVLDDVAGGGEQRAADPERGPVQDHGRHAGGGGRHGGQPEQGVADHGPDHGGRQGLPRPRAGTSRAPATSTSRLTPRLPQSTAWSRKPSRRWSGGTGSMPHSGAAWMEKDLGEPPSALPSPVPTGSGSKGRRPLQSASQPGPPGSPGTSVEGPRSP